MSQNIHSNPKLYIAGALIPTCQGASISFPGQSQVSKFTAQIADPDIEEASLFGKEVVYYLNYGGGDSVPIFRGYITQVSGSETSVSITAMDVRGYLTLDFRKIELTDKNNYDGFTLGQFLKYYIDTFINKEKIYIGTDLINDTNPAASLSKMRGTFKVYDLVVNILQNTLDEQDDNEPLDYTLNVINEVDNSSLVFNKKKKLTAIPSMSLSRTDGIIKLSYKERPRKYVASLKDREFVYGSNPTGPFNIPISEATDKDKKLTPEELREIARKKILKEFNNNIEISIQASKGHYINVGDMVQLNVQESILLGSHRITSKKIQVKSGGVDLSFTLNKEPIKLSEYIKISF